MRVQRLKTRQQYQAVLASAIIARTDHFVMHCMDLASDTAEPSPWPKSAVGAIWLGIMAPKRWARRAVTRNLIRRLVFTANLPDGVCGTSAAILVRLRAGFDPKKYPSARSTPLRAAIRQEIEQLFRRAGRSRQEVQ